MRYKADCTSFFRWTIRGWKARDSEVIQGWTQNKKSTLQVGALGTSWKWKLQNHNDWNPEQIIRVYDSNCEVIEDEIALYSGSLVKVALRQAAYAFGFETGADQVGTSLRLRAIQVIKQVGVLEPDGFDPHGAFGVYHGGYGIHQDKT